MFDCVPCMRFIVACGLLDTLFDTLQSFEWPSGCSCPTAVDLQPEFEKQINCRKKQLLICLAGKVEPDLVVVLLVSL